VGILCGIALVALALSDLQVPGLPPESSAPSKITYNFSSAAKGLSVAVHPPQDHLVAGHAIPMEVIFSDFTTKPIAVHVSWTAPCFVVTPAQPDDFTVAAGSSYLLNLSVVANCDTGAEPITLYFWTKDFDPPYVSVASIAPIRITAGWEHKLFRVFFLFAALLKTLAIPAVLAWLAFWFQRRSADRDECLKEEQEARDRRESVLTTRIPEYSRIVQEHYLPISRRGDTIESEMPPLLKKVGAIEPGSVEETELKTKAAAAFGALKSDSANELWRVLCAIMLYRARLLKLFSSKGGIYFRSNQAERLFAELLNSFFAAIYQRLQKEDFSEAVAVLDPEERLSSALHRCLNGKGKDAPASGEAVESGFAAGRDAGAAKRAAGRAEVRENLERFERVFDRFKAWILDDPAEFRAYTRLIQLSSRILDFECDRPFYQTGPYSPSNPVEPEQSGWYFDPPLLNFQREMYQFPWRCRPRSIRRFPITSSMCRRNASGDSRPIQFVRLPRSFGRANAKRRLISRLNNLRLSFRFRATLI
jgi:hypothetical protein